MRICLISSIHPWVNPRLVKEADTLSLRGHDVFVVTKRVDAWSDARDQDVLQGKSWCCLRANLLRRDKIGTKQWLLAAMRAKVALTAYALLPTLSLAEEAYYRGFTQVLDLALSTRADLYIAHTQGALAIAARAASHSGVPYAFDCEDLLAEEAADGLRNLRIRRAILQIEQAYIPGAAYVSATSRSMATYLAERYGILKPRIIHNVFSVDELKGIAPPSHRKKNKAVEMVWMSASIGPGRGLEDVLMALPSLPEHVRLTIYGRMLPFYQPSFRALLEGGGISDRVVVKPIPQPDQIMPTLANFDIGLTLDQNDCLNRSLTICNKVFLYLQAGLMIVATDTPGQREILDDVSRCGVLYPSGKYNLLVKRVLPYILDPRQLLEVRCAAWHSGQVRYNWEVEQSELLQAVESSVRASANATNTIAVS
jgi:glycosyltransferase involved in cell wall biosynthesis